MSAALEIVFSPLTASLEPTAVVFTGSELAMGDTVKALNTRAGGLILKAADASNFKGKARSSFELLAPPKIDIERLIIAGAGKVAEKSEVDWTNLGGYVYGQLGARKTLRASIVADFDDLGDTTPGDAAALLAFGVVLRHYNFTKYKSKKSGGEEGTSNGDGPDVAAAAEELTRLVIHTAEADKAKSAFQRHQAVANGVSLARDLVNEPANALGPVEFADRVKELERLGLDVEILDDRCADGPENEYVAVCCPRQRPARARRDHAMERRQIEARQAHLFRRQGRCLRYRRLFDQAGGGHGRHEGRYGRRGCRHGPHVRPGRT